MSSKPGLSPKPKLTVVTDEPPECVHHWLLGEPAEGQITARCVKCEGTRIFAASPQSTDRFDDYRELTASSSYNAGRASA